MEGFYIAVGCYLLIYFLGLFIYGYIPRKKEVKVEEEVVYDGDGNPF